MPTRPDPDPFAAARAELQRFRLTRRRGRFPESLWSLAVSLAEQHGVARTAFDLGLDEYGLRRRLPSASRGIAPMALSPSFVDAVMSTPSPPARSMAPTLSCSERGGVAEFLTPRGVKLRIEWRGDAPDLALLSRSIFADSSDSP